MRILRMGMSGSDVREIQIVLNRLGYNLGPADGIFGQATHNAVVQFQRVHGLVPDGVVGLLTYRALSQYMLEIVPTNTNYDYQVLEDNVQRLKNRYPFIEVGIIGSSTLGRSLYSIKLGTGNNVVLYQAAHHSLEWITSVVLMKFTEEFLKSFSRGQRLLGFGVQAIWDTSTIYIIPMINPDGIDLVLNGLRLGNPNYSNLIAWNNGSRDFSTVWQANNRGVDLNHNYDAGFTQSQENAIESGITGPGPTRYPGPFPESEPESRSLAQFTRRNNISLALSYHSQGEVIYTNFSALSPEALAIGQLLSRVSGYTFEAPTGIASSGGYNDWFTTQFHRPGFTIEVGLGKNPLPISQFPEIFSDNLPLLLLASILSE